MNWIRSMPLATILRVELKVFRWEWGCPKIDFNSFCINLMQTKHFYEVSIKIRKIWTSKDSWIHPWLFFLLTSRPSILINLQNLLKTRIKIAQRAFYFTVTTQTDKTQPLMLILIQKMPLKRFIDIIISLPKPFLIYSIRTAFIYKTSNKAHLVKNNEMQRK